MFALRATVRGWGRSLGVVIPKGIIEEARIEAGDTLELLVKKKESSFKELFGAAAIPRKISTKELLKQTDREAWDG